MISNPRINFPHAEREQKPRVAFALRWPTQAPLPVEQRRRICCIIPCYNVGRLCEPVIRECAGHVGQIIVVDDGSTDDTHRYIEAARQGSGDIVQILKLSENGGKGAALLHGFKAALAHENCEVIVTLDGDGQHRPGDIPRIARPALLDQADLVIAQRQFAPSVPARSRVGNNLSAAILTSAYRHSPRDTQCGLRAHRRALVQEMANTVQGHRYDTEARILMLCLRWGRRIAQVPIPAIYLGRNESSHYRPLADSLRILGAFFTTVAIPELGIPTSFQHVKDWITGSSK